MAQKMSLQPCRLLLRNVPPVLSLNAAILATLLALVPVARADDDLARGEALVGENCGRCHAIGRTGTSPHRQAPAFRTLGQRYPIETLEEALGEGDYRELEVNSAAVTWMRRAAWLARKGKLANG